MSYLSLSADFTIFLTYFYSFSCASASKGSPATDLHSKGSSPRCKSIPDIHNQQPQYPFIILIVYCLAMHSQIILPIAHRQGTHSCVTKHPISNFVSCQMLSPSFSYFISSFSGVSILITVQDVLSDPTGHGIGNGHYTPE